MDLIQSGLLYVIMIYLIFRLIKKRKGNDNDSNDGGISHLTPPKIDLPPGVSWPVSDPECLEKEVEDVY